jgi:hypothetical protein
LQALNDVGQSRSILYQNIVRCIDLWKEANLPLTPPVPDVVHANAEESEGRNQEHEEREEKARKDCVELAMRLGIPEKSALLALDVFPDYQVCLCLLSFDFSANGILTNAHTSSH